MVTLVAIINQVADSARVSGRPPARCFFHQSSAAEKKNPSSRK